jgi:hypothetical protein
MTRIIVYTLQECPKCPPFKALCLSVFKALGLVDGDYEFRDWNVFRIEAAQHQVGVVPALVIDDELMYNVNLPSEFEVTECIRAKLNSK